MKRFIPLVVAAAGFTLMSAAPASAATSMVYAAGYTFLPPAAVNHPGDGLVLTNTDYAAHTLTSLDKQADGITPLFDSGPVGHGGSMQVNGVTTLPAGTYRFYCTYHQWMQGVLQVTAS